MSGFTSYADIYDPEVLKMLIGENWLNDPRVVQSGIVMRDQLQIQGTLGTNIRQKRFQDSSGQALKAGDPISSVGKVQEAVNSPILWRYNSSIDPDAIADIESKLSPDMNASLAGDISSASAQYVDDSAIAIMEGVGAALSSNQTSGTGATITLAKLNAAKAKSLDKTTQLDSGAIILDSKVFYDLVALGLLAATANTFGIQLQQNMVASGNLPTNVLGLTPIVTDKLSSAPSSEYYTYLVGANSLVLQGNGSPQVEVHRLTDTFATRTNFKLRYGLGVRAMKWGVSGKEDATDTELATSTNWTLSTNAKSNDVAIYRLLTA